MKKTIVVMPVANEESTIGGLLEAITKLPYTELYIYLIIDLYSKDQTEEIIRDWESKTKNIKCIFYKESQGVISCYLEGFRRALEDGAEQIIEMDGGGSHRPEEIPQFIEKLEEGYDCVWGSRFIQGGDICNHPWYRKFLSKGGTLLSNLVLGTSLKDMTSGFEGFQKHVLKDMNLDGFLSKGHIYQTEMRYYCRHLRTMEVPIHYKGGTSSLKWTSVTEALKVLFLLKKNEAIIWNTKRS